jgi:hypothetical protein
VGKGALVRVDAWAKSRGAFAHAPTTLQAILPTLRHLLFAGLTPPWPAA